VTVTSWVGVVTSSTHAHSAQDNTLMAVAHVQRNTVKYDYNKDYFIWNTGGGDINISVTFS